MDTLTLETQLHDAFPERKVLGAIAHHACEECCALRLQLAHTTWSHIPAEFVRESDGSLPLLTEEAYIAFLPAWLLQGIREPSEEVAAMLLVNLRHEPRTDGFTPEQAATIIDVARFITANSIWGPSDPVNVDALAAIKAGWGKVVS